ncbi:MAG: hypothetical protein DWQ37_05670 [Planctomycetota bacterium]|nr:MAG: hypothetical protein DWQ37_05670 [Planctomycetota bacterium]
MTRLTTARIGSCLFVLALFLTAGARGATIEWLVANGGNGHFYNWVGIESTWQEAFDMAASMTHNGMPGYLATITSEAENNFIIGNFNQRGWLAGSDAAVEGEWRWVAGPETGELFFVGEYPDPNRQTLIYADWGGNEPNDYDNTQFGFPYPGEDYLQFDPARGGEWNDSPGAPQTDAGFYVEFGPIVPEPASLLMMGQAGLIALALAWRKLSVALRRRTD